MRSTNRVVHITKPVSIQVVNEEISHYVVSKKSVTVHVSCMDALGEQVQQESFEITGENFTMLMSDSPSFAPGKPVNEFRRDDLWYFIDQLRS